MKTTNTLLAVAFSLGTLSSYASDRAQERPIIRVNSEVTTHIVMPENLKMVDISTENIIGNQCADNMVRIKPAPIDSIAKTHYSNKDFLGTITLIGERHIAQYDIEYCREASRANSIYNVNYNQTQNYTNPDVSMPESEMSRFAWAIYGSKRKFNNIRSSSNGIKAQVYNIYSIGNYFFIDFALTNKSKIMYDIDEVKITLNDKKETKATNSQSIQLTPVYSLNPANTFNKNYRQILVLDKLTFPEEKVLTITITEKQISGRVVNLSMEYADILNADDFDIAKADPKPHTKYVRVVDIKYKNPKDDESLKKANDNLVSKNRKLDRLLNDTKDEVNRLKKENSELTLKVNKLEIAYNDASKTIDRMLNTTK